MLISLRQVTKVYRMGEIDISALDGVSLDIERGDFVAIMGASGSGKSTLLNIIGCLDQPTGGEYHLDGEEVSRLNGDALAKVRNTKIGFVFQSFNLLPRTSALENVELPLFYGRSMSGAKKRKKAETILQRLGLGDRMKHHPSQLSGGQQQRVAISRALVNDPALVLADEPTGNLDFKSGQEIMAVFKELNESGITLVMVAHDVEIAEHARRLIHMRDGRIV